MTVLFCDSFDHYLRVDHLLKWTTSGNAFTRGDAELGAFGRNGTNGYRSLQSANGWEEWLEKSGLPNSATLTVGFGFRTNVLGSIYIIQLKDGVNVQVSLVMQADGTIRVARGANVAVLGYSTTRLSLNTYYYVELKTTFHGTTGTIELRINGATELTLAAQNTAPSGLNQANALRVGPSAGGSYFDYDDLYLCDGLGAINNTFLGDVRVGAYFPNANGTYSQLVGSDLNSVDNYLLVDEAAPNGDLDYVQSDVLNSMDSYAVQDLAANVGSVKAVQVLLNVRKDDAGARSIAPLVRSGVTDAVGATKALSTTFTYEREVFETNPANAGAAWTPADFNAAQFGMKVVV